MATRLAALFQVRPSAELETGQPLGIELEEQRCLLQLDAMVLES